MADPLPNPGSDEAVKLGCKCPRIDNAHGRGYMGACPLHTKELAEGGQKQ